MSPKNYPTQYYLEYFFLFWFQKILRGMTHSGRYRLANILGWIGYFFIPYRKKVILANLRKAFPDRSGAWYHQIVRQAYCHFATVFLDICSIYEQKEVRFQQLISSVNPEVIDEALAEGKGVVLVLFHFGNWEILADWLARAGYPVAAVAAPLKNRLVNRKILQMRTRHGIQIIPKGKRGNLRLLRHLKDNHILLLLVDQDARHNGIWIRFFDQWSSAFRGPILLASHRQSPVILATCLREASKKYSIHLERLDTNLPAGDVPAVQFLTQKYTNYFEHLIRQHPTQYYWFHRRWKTKPPHEILNQQLDILPCDR
jgi:KDO2-lipid IV(A) lauroyltransferase